jgi:hypothetical protein
LKRFVSIVLLLVFLFNVGGYYLVFIGLHHRSDLLLTQKIESNQYEYDETMELKIPVSLPYPMQHNGFERINGKFEYQGNFYKLVKQKIENDTVYIVCIRDTNAERLTTTLKDYVKKTSDLPANSKNPTSQLGKFLKDFENPECELIQSGAGWQTEIIFGEKPFTFNQAVISLTSPPPKA